MQNKEQPNVETIPVPDIEKGGLEVTPDGVLLTPEEAEERRKRLAENPEDWREQK